MKLEKSSGNIRKYILPVLALIFVAFVLQMFYSRRHIEVTELKPMNGILDIAETDFENQVYNVVNNWDYYPNRLYFHEDFNSGVKENPVQAGKDISSDSVPFGTYRVVIKSRPYSVYSICGFSVDYSTRAFVNGVEVLSYGRVAKTAEDSVPGGGYMTVPVKTDETGTAEIIYQYSNFVHNEGGFIPPVYLSTPQNIEEYKAGNALVSIGISGAMFVMALYFLLLSAVQRQQTYICIAFCCIIMSLRDNLFWGSFLLPADTSWYFIYRATLVITALIPVTFLMLLRSFYSLGNRWINIGYITAIAVNIVLMLVFDTKKVLCSVRHHIFSLFPT